MLRKPRMLRIFSVTHDDLVRHEPGIFFVTAARDATICIPGGCANQFSRLVAHGVVEQHGTDPKRLTFP